MAQLIKATITDISDTTATLTLESGSTVSWPADQLPDGSGEGDIVHMVSNSVQAKDLLNELLSEQKDS